MGPQLLLPQFSQPMALLTFTRVADESTTTVPHPLRGPSMHSQAPGNFDPMHSAGALAQQENLLD